MPPKKIKDTEIKKPEDWDGKDSIQQNRNVLILFFIERELIDDPEDKKPANWDNQPEYIPDPDATKPEDW